ncbi:hypothetical protein [Bowmanella pacifica]|nr:hypothetical protein [Bowmanella pacifica]
MDSKSFKWSVNGEVVSKAESYLLDYENVNNEIRIDVSVTNEDLVSTSAFKLVFPERTQVVDIASSNYAFSALKSDGSVISWGKLPSGVDYEDVSTKHRRC